MLRRKKTLSLNGNWTLTTAGHTGKITVPYPPESKLSGFEGEISESLVYEREFEAPALSDGESLILHFGAVDRKTQVFIDGKPAVLRSTCKIQPGNDTGDGEKQTETEHNGGYLAFEVEEAEQYFISKSTRSHSLRVEVTDDLSHVYPYGKQRKKRGGMWYTPISGIWKEVWLEVVPKDTKTEERIREIRITPDLEGIRVERILEKTDSYGFDVLIPELGIAEHTDGTEIYINIPDGEYWTPENPRLYDITVRNHIDEVKSYFALRTVTIGDVNGVSRILLNGKPYFFHGVLDQGYFEDGIYTPKTPEAYEKDILAMKKLGFNMLRKHIKVEPECFYEACDRLGMVVFQDMVNNGDYSFLRDTALPTVGLKHLNDRYLHTNRITREEYKKSMEGTIRQLYNHPCICYYTLFNEGWGQFCSDEMYDLAKSFDKTRIIDSTSGWFAQKKSDVESLHVYFKPVKVTPSKRPIVISEFGGYSLREAGHLFSEKNYGYRDIASEEELTKAIDSLYENEIIHSIKDGICATVYTQLSDVEDETNGLLTYDREVVKVDEDRMQLIAQRIRERNERTGL